MRWAVAAGFELMLAGTEATMGESIRYAPPGFAYLRDIAPEIRQDIRYAGPDNFVGRALPGYDAPECLLRPVAEALKHIQAELAAHGLGLKVYDCYRPLRAVQAMLAWSRKSSSSRNTKRFFPELLKSTLVSEGYIAARSRHSSGIAVDVSIVVAGSPYRPSFDPTASYASCVAPVNEQEPDDSIDMGTGFDCFDPVSATDSQLVTSEERQNRILLLSVMQAGGFDNYPREWLHFEYRIVRPMRAIFDFPILPHR